MLLPALLGGLVCLGSCACWPQWALLCPEAADRAQFFPSQRASWERSNQNPPGPGRAEAESEMLWVCLIPVDAPTSSPSGCWASSEPASPLSTCLTRL